jgi:hypothetical protein
VAGRERGSMGSCSRENIWNEDVDEEGDTWMTLISRVIFLEILQWGPLGRDEPVTREALRRLAHAAGFQVPVRTTITDATPCKR